MILFSHAADFTPVCTTEFIAFSKHYDEFQNEGAVIGVVTGILGAGGGFLIIPELVLLMGMPMKRAVGASLLIIAL